MRPYVLLLWAFDKPSHGVVDELFAAVFLVAANSSTTRTFLGIGNGETGRRWVIVLHATQQFFGSISCRSRTRTAGLEQLRGRDSVQYHSGSSTAYAAAPRGKLARFNSSI